MRATTERPGPSGFRRATRWAAAGLAGSVLLAACSGGSLDEPASEPAEGGDAAAVESMSFWAAQEMPPAVIDLIERYGEERDVDVEITTVPGPFEQNALTRWTAGDRPDVLFWQPFEQRLRQLQPEQNLQDVGDLPAIARTKYGIAEGSGDIDGTKYAFTFGFPAVYGLFYNKAVLQEAGVEPPTTQEELDAALTSLQQSGTTPVHLAGGDPWTLQIGPLSWMTDAAEDGLIEQINSADAEWTDPAVVEAFANLKDVVDGGFTNPDFATATYVDQQAALASGEAAMAFQASWLVPAMTASAGPEGVEDIGYVPMPSESGAAMWQATNLGSMVLPRTGNADQEAAARDFATWLSDDAYADYLAATGEPSVFEGVDDPAGLPTVMTEVLEAFEQQGTRSVSARTAAATGAVGPLTGELLIGVKTAEQVGESMQSEFVKNAELVGLEGF